jgi:hypothetical protein
VENYLGMMRVLDRMKARQKDYVEFCRRRGITPAITYDFVELERMAEMEANKRRAQRYDLDQDVEGEAP